MRQQPPQQLLITPNNRTASTNSIITPHSYGVDELQSCADSITDYSSTSDLSSINSQGGYCSSRHDRLPDNANKSLRNSTGMIINSQQQHLISNYGEHLVPGNRPTLYSMHRPSEGNGVISNNGSRYSSISFDDVMSVTDSGIVKCRKRDLSYANGNMLQERNDVDPNLCQR